MPVIEYKCPNCGSGMRFDSATGMLACPGCGRQDDIELLADPLKEQAAGANEAGEYHCTSCGAVIEADPETSATSCSACGSAVVLSERLAGPLAPVQVIPFAISKEEAVKAFKKWCGKGLVTPGGFMTADRIKGMKGIYVPFWLYDLNNRVEVHGHGTKVRTYRQGDYQITETQHFDIYRRIQLNYTKLPIDASGKMDDKLMDTLEPFPYGQLKDFKSPYLAGYIAEKYGYTDEELYPRAKNKIQPYIKSYISSTVSGYTTVSLPGEQIDTSVKRSAYVLLPVWMLSYDYNRKEYTFAMNGQTGKVVGKPPISMAKVTGWFAGVSAVSFLALRIAAWLMGGEFL